MHKRINESEIEQLARLIEKHRPRQKVEKSVDIKALAAALRNKTNRTLSRSENMQDSLTSGNVVVIDTQSNPLYTYVDLVITPLDVPNKNQQMIPASEANNIIATATMAPIKVNAHSMKHASAVIVGIITDAYIEDNVIKGNGLLYNDNSLVQDLISESNQYSLSWEIYHTASTFVNGVEMLLNCIFSGICIVNNPSYGSLTYLKVKQ